MGSAYKELQSRFEKELRAEQKRNRHIVTLNMNAYNRKQGVREGDFVRAKNGKMYRIAYIWRDENNIPYQWQTDSGRGHYYLGKGYVSMSGGLNSGFQEGTKFKNLGYKRNGSIWIFKDNFATGDNGLDYDDVKFRVFQASTNPKI